MLANERIHFKHPAKVSGKEGELIVSDVQVLMTSSNGQNLVQVPWANVSAVEYAPAKTGLAVFRLKTNVESMSIIAIEITGSTKEKNLSELGELRAIITTIRSGGPGAIAKKVKINEASSERKRQLLSADSELNRKYQDLVEHSKLISADEFWASHQDALQTHDIEQAGKKMKKGDVSIQVAIQEVARNMKQTDDGKFIVDLSEDLKLKILSRYPMVRRDYDREVPHRQTEASFWYKFFLQQRFRASETKSASTNATYTSSMTATIPANDANKSEEEAKKRRRVSVENDIDLTATFMDYAKKEHFDAGDTSIIDNINASVKDINEESKHAVESSEGNVTKKAKKAVEFGGAMDPILTFSQHDNDRQIGGHGYEQVEEGRRQQVAFEQRLLQAGQTASAADNPISSSSATSSAADNRQAMLIRLRDTFQQHMTLSNHILPTAERASNFFHKVEVGHRLKQAEKEQQHLLTSRMNAATSSQNELREDYSEVAELLLHFHHLLQRMHTQRSNSDGKERAANILTALQRKAQVVDRKRRILMTTSAMDEKSEEAVAIANHILQLVQRGEGRWQQTLQEISI